VGRRGGLLRARRHHSPVANTRYGRVSILVCYDAEFPELLAVLTNRPAVRVPSAERPNVVVNIQAAAFANRMFIAAAYRTGTERGVARTGSSVIVGPDGCPIAGPAGTGPEPIYAHCDLSPARSKANGPRTPTAGSTCTRPDSPG
jgi:predicted amidohydrolase